ncbi:hypothetical protein MTP03_42950 [Tsukamurella sp. PLM1]|nr:hypothetical protein MTP03_42950 [Tsukamurella sp. PLM1]
MGTNQRGQIQMTEAEIEDFLERSRTATIATLGASGRRTSSPCGTP